jgi:hypothetical protein
MTVPGWCKLSPLAQGLRRGRMPDGGPLRGGRRFCPGLPAAAVGLSFGLKRYDVASAHCDQIKARSGRVLSCAPVSGISRSGWSVVCLFALAQIANYLVGDPLNGSTVATCNKGQILNSAGTPSSATSVPTSMSVLVNIAISGCRTS